MEEFLDLGDLGGEASGSFEFLGQGGAAFGCPAIPAISRGTRQRNAAAPCFLRCLVFRAEPADEAIRFLGGALVVQGD